MFYRILIFGDSIVTSRKSVHSTLVNVTFDRKTLADVTERFANYQDALAHARAMQCLMGLDPANSEIDVFLTVSPVVLERMCSTES